MALKQKYPQNIYTSFGLHPWFIKSDEFSFSRHFEDLKIWVDQADFIGEVGLDFIGDAEIIRKETQINLFEKQLGISSSKPFVLHVVQAHGKALEILKNFSIRGFVHSFSGSIEVAESYLAEGLMLSFGPGILNENFKKAREALKEVPLTHLLVESDTPSNPLDDSDPLLQLEETYEAVARIRGEEVQEIKDQVSQNLQSLLVPR